jgi:hypothetical protein
MLSEPHPAPEFLQEIGLITTLFAAVEVNLTVILRTLIGGQALVADAVTAQLSVAQLVAALSGVLSVRTDDAHLRGIVREACAEVMRCEQTRNQIIHSLWVASPFPGRAARIKYRSSAKRGFSIEDEHWNLDALKAFSRELTSLIRVLDELNSALLRILPASAPSSGKAVTRIRTESLWRLKDPADKPST